VLTEFLVLGKVGRNKTQMGTEFQRATNITFILTCTAQSVRISFKANRRWAEHIVSMCAPCFMLVSCLAYSSTLKLIATSSSETSFTFDGLHGFIS
jgi:uncharacterized membrane protein YeiB